MRITTIYLTTSLLLLAFLTGCNGDDEPALPDCNGDGFQIIPTATRPSDPDLFNPPPPPDEGDNAIYCLTPIPTATPIAMPPSGFTATEVINLSLDIADQELAAVAVGDDLMAVAWLAAEGDESAIYVALGRGGGHFQVRRVDAGSAVSLAFSRINRLHVVYEQDGQIQYRAADQGVHPADVEPIFVAAGYQPKVVVDAQNWAHVFYAQDGSLFQAKHLSGEAWLTQFVTHGELTAVYPFYNEEVENVFGIPGGHYWFGLFLTVRDAETVRLLRYLSWFNLWQQVASFSLPPDTELIGPIGLDYLAQDADTAWVYAAWVTRQPVPLPQTPFFSQPQYEAANPLYPDQIANPDTIYSGLNAIRWRSQDAPFDAGLQQSVTVSDPNSPLTFSAWGLAQTEAEANLTLRLGIDPDGGGTPDGPEVVWSPATTPTAFTPFSVTVLPAAETVTLFLRGVLSSPDQFGLVAWDGAAVTNGTLLNGDFEEAFSPAGIPDGWTSFYQDSGSNPPGERDAYQVYAAWSADGGASWTEPIVVAENRDPNGSRSGAIRPDVFPVLSLATDPPSASFFYLYETGDPPPGSNFIRFGRPTQMICTMGMMECATAPGTAFLSRTVIRPSMNLRLVRDPFDDGRVVLTWDALQADNVGKDIYATYGVMR